MKYAVAKTTEQLEEMKVMNISSATYTEYARPRGVTC